MGTATEGDACVESKVERREAPQRDDSAVALLRVIDELSARPARPAEYALAASRLRHLSAEAARELGLRPLRTFIVRSVTVEPFLPQLLVHAAATARAHLSFEVGSYGAYVDDLVNRDGQLARMAPDLVLILFDSDDVAGGVRRACARGCRSEIEQAIDDAAKTIIGWLRALRAQTKARIVFQGFTLPDRTALGDVGDANVPMGEARAVATINERLAAVCREIGDAVFFDQDRVAARYGRAAWRDERMFSSNRLAIAAGAFTPYCVGLARAIRSLYNPPRKVLVTDLDNTLWGGIVGEDGPDGIQSGSSFPGTCYSAFQSALKHLAARGVLLAIASKNNEADVREVFRRRGSDLSLALDDFAAVRIGWNDKAESLRDIARELNVGLDSLVFVDDNAVECASMRAQLPEVHVVHMLPEEPWSYARRIFDLECFDTPGITEEDRNRTQEYRNQALRLASEMNARSKEEFLASLGIVCQIIDAREAPLSRSAQLLAKTNQFNLTTRRHSERDIIRFAEAPNGQALAIRARDRFGDAGVVGLALCRQEGEACVIDSFLLSCRVIGRGVESVLLAKIAENARAGGAKQLVGEYIPTSKNAPCAKFYESHGFGSVNNSPGTHPGSCYQLDLTASRTPRADWIRLE